MDAAANQTDTSALARQSAVFVWTDRALFVGDRSETDLHSHHAVELCIALDDLGIDMSTPGGEDFRGVAGAIVRAGAEHQLAIPGPKVAVMYLDPQTGIAAAIEDTLGEEDIAPLPADVMTRHRSAFRHFLESSEAGLHIADTACSNFIAELATEAPRPAVDRRVRKAMEHIDTHLDTPPTLESLAEVAGVSASRLRHMFKEQTGLPISRYVLWMRLRAALVHALEGTTMAQAAQEAGFSDAAHFTRTCKQMFGLPPTAFAPVDAVFVAQ